MKTLLITLLLTGNLAKAEYNVDFEGWGDKVKLTVHDGTKKYILKTSIKEVEKYKKCRYTGCSNIIKDFISEVVNAN